jgi:GTPase
LTSPRTGAGLDLKRSGPEFTRAVIVHVEPKTRKAVAAVGRDAATRLAEAVGLAKAIDLAIVAELVVMLASPRPATLMGTGKMKDIGELVSEHEAELVVVNAQLSPVQQRNLETEWKAKVLDRTGLILEIFGRRASTKEGSLQVELAHLQYQKSRLVRSWTHLERQRGGFGFLGGPGESQIETDRRLIQERIEKIEKGLAGVVKTRALHRSGRDRVPFPVVALVGYTNAGKSTLFNRLTGAGVLAKDLLFATLDPTMRNLVLPGGQKAILSDTVGFISELPTALIAAFRATLEEVLSASVILHVRDVSHPETDAQAEDVENILTSLGLDDARRGQIVEVWNKADLLDPLSLATREAQAARRKNCVLVSAQSGAGVETLLQLVEAKLASGQMTYEIKVAPEDGKGLAWIHRHGKVLASKTRADGTTRITARLDAEIAGKAKSRFGGAMRRSHSA